MYNFPVEAAVFQHLCQTTALIEATPAGADEPPPPVRSVLSVRGNAVFSFYGRYLLPQLDNIPAGPSGDTNPTPYNSPLHIYPGEDQYPTLFGLLVIRTITGSRTDHPNVLLSATNIQRLVHLPWSKPIIRAAIWRTMQEHEPSRHEFTQR